MILDTVKVFVNYASQTREDQLIKDVLTRVQAPLITLMASSEVSNTHELTFVVLAHIKFIVSRGDSSQFAKECKRFYCKVDEPSYIQFLKLEILAYVAEIDNLGNILNELSVYVQEVNNLLARKSIETLGKIASRLEETIQPILQSLSQFFLINNEQITN